jgi:hypothetical protein
MAGGKIERREVLRMLSLAAGATALPSGLLLSTGCAGSTPLNPIQQENSKQGDPSWIIPAANHAWYRIEGYASSPSVNRGGSISFFVSTDQPDYTLKIFRLGWYDGVGARLLKTVQLTGVLQPKYTVQPVTNMVDCNWANPYVLNVPYNPVDPTDWASGIYLAQLTQKQSGKQNYIPFVVRDDARSAAIKFVAGFATWVAYNAFGGYSLYVGGDPQVLATRARKASLNRPFYSALGAGNLLGLGYEISALRFLEREGYDITYTDDITLHQNSSELLNSNIAFFGGHDEYFTRAMRNNLQAAIDAGVHAVFTDANSIYWQSRFESDNRGATDRVLVCYREADEDPYAANPATQAETTVKFRDPPVNWPEESIVGAMFNLNSNLGATGDLIIQDASHWIFAGTGLSTGDRLVNYLGPEVDSTFGLAPAGTQTLAQSPFEAVLGNGTAVMTIYRATSGALVFDSGTSRFNYGLDDYRKLAQNFSPTIIGLAEGTCPGASSVIQQMARNLFSYMGVR